MAREARKHDVDGVVCGHIHHAELRTIDGVLYVNTGDWVESCTALAEHHDGRLEIIRWLPTAHERTSPAMMHGRGDGHVQREVSIDVTPAG